MRWLIIEEFNESSSIESETYVKLWHYYKWQTGKKMKGNYHGQDSICPKFELKSYRQTIERPNHSLVKPDQTHEDGCHNRFPPKIVTGHTFILAVITLLWSICSDHLFGHLWPILSGLEILSNRHTNRKTLQTKTTEEASHMITQQSRHHVLLKYPVYVWNLRTRKDITS
jgi:hypothetical protein